MEWWDDSMYDMPLETYIKHRMASTKEARKLLGATPTDMDFIRLLWEKQYYQVHYIRNTSIKEGE
jgi:hypothetical protein